MTERSGIVETTLTHSGAPRGTVVTGTSGPPEVARAVLNALTAKTPRTRYPAGVHAGRMMALYRLLPDRLLDRVILRDVRLPCTSGVHTEPSIQHTERSSKSSQRFLHG